MPRPSRLNKSSGQRTENAGLVVTSQQTRFDVDLEAPTSKTIDVKDLTISIGGLELLDHAHLRVVEGVHYVFVGRNGTGKSTLLRALADRRVPGVPANLRILLLGQTRISSDVVVDGEEEQSPSFTVLEHVTRSDVRRQRAIRDADSMYPVS